MPPFPLESCLSTHMPSARHAESAPIDAILPSRARTTPSADTGDARGKHSAIDGGGPAGALCGEKLAVAGFDVTLFDEHLAWEKPCGGGLTHKAIERYPFLLSGPETKKEIHTAELISSRGHRARFEMSRPRHAHRRWPRTYRRLRGTRRRRAKSVAAGYHPSSPAGSRSYARLFHPGTGRSRQNQISGSHERLSLVVSAHRSFVRRHLRHDGQIHDIKIAPAS